MISQITKKKVGSEKVRRRARRARRGVEEPTKREKPKAEKE